MSARTDDKWQKSEACKEKNSYRGKSSSCLGRNYGWLLSLAIEDHIVVFFDLIEPRILKKFFDSSAFGRIGFKHAQSGEQKALA